MLKGPGLEQEPPHYAYGRAKIYSLYFSFESVTKQRFTLYVLALNPLQSQIPLSEASVQAGIPKLTACYFQGSNFPHSQAKWA